MSIGNFFKKTLIVIHRYAGIPLSLLIIVWLVSGVVMMYAGGLPAISPTTQLEKLPPLDLAAVQLTPGQASERLVGRGGGGGLGTPTLTTLLERPAYRFGGRTIFADTGETLQPLDLDAARGVAARYIEVPDDRLRFVETVERVDQWTIAMRQTLPLHRFDDSDGTRVYVSPRSARVELVTTPRTRALAWAGTIPHWLYFEALRTKPIWTDVVIWTSSAASVLAVIGLVLGVWQMRKRPAKGASLTPYRGWLRWHHITGLFFGLFALTWAFSGLLSMEPFEWTNAETSVGVDLDVFTGGDVALDRYPPFDASAWRAVLGERTLKEIEFQRIRGDHYYTARYSSARPSAVLAAPASASNDAAVDGEPRRERLHQPYDVAGRNEHGRLLIAADTLTVRTAPFEVESLVAALRESVTEAKIVDYTVLDEHDSYYYSRGDQAALPALRIKFDDPLATWLYVDLTTSQLVGDVHRWSRLERWLFNGLHSLDFNFWYDKRPLWDIGMIVLTLGALATTSIGLILGVQRMRRGTVRGLRRLGLLRKRIDTAEA